MTSWKTVIVLVLCMAATPAAWAAEPAKQAEAAKAGATWDSIKTFSLQEKTKAVDAGKKLIAETDRKIADLGRQARNATGEAKAAHAANMQDLQAKKLAAQAELDKLGKASAAVWDATKTGVSEAGKALGLAYDKAAAAVKP